MCFFICPMPTMPPLFPGFAEHRLALADQVEMAYLDNGKAATTPP